MLDTLLLGKILLKDAEMEYVATLLKKIFQRTPKNLPKKNHVKKIPPKTTQKHQKRRPKKNRQKNCQKSPKKNPH